MAKKSMIPISRPDIGPEEIKAVQGVLKSGTLAQGKHVERFERAFARFCGTKHAVAVGNGTQALTLSLMALDPPLGSLSPITPLSRIEHPTAPTPPVHRRFEVITTPFTFVATANAILAAGGTPVFVDIDPDTFNIDPDLVAKAIGPNTRAILPVHLYGLPADMDPINELAREHDLAVIEDACQAHGAVYKGRKAGNLHGDTQSSCGTFSFYPTKNMTTGEGGMVTTNDPELADHLRHLRNHGMPPEPGRRYEYLCTGYNTRMTEMAAAIGLVQLKKVTAGNRRRLENARAYNEALESVSDVLTPPILTKSHHVYHQYTVRIRPRKAPSIEVRRRLMEGLDKEGIMARIYYPSSLADARHLGPASRTVGGLERTEEAIREVLSLPVAPHVTKADIIRIGKAVRKVLGA